MDCNTYRRKPTYSKLLFSLLFLFVASSLHAQPQQAYALLKSQPSLKNAQWGMVVRNLKTGKDLVLHNPDYSLTTGSTIKVLTTGTALAMLGKDFKVQTTLAYTGSIDAAGTLQGDLCIIGEGDPTLGCGRFGASSTPEAVLAAWQAAVAKAGIRAIAGSVVGIQGYFEGPAQPDGWPFGDLGSYYGAGTSGLCWRENMYKLYFGTSTLGSAAVLKSMTPANLPYTFDNQVTAGHAGSGDQAYIYETTKEGERLLQGTIPILSTNFEVKGALKNPALACAQDLYMHLRAAKIEIAGSYKAQDKISKGQNRTDILVLQSPSLEAIVGETNRESINLFAETCLRWIAKANEGSGSTPKGIDKLKAFWKDRGLDLEGFLMQDGSGLSPANGVTPRQMTSILDKLSKDTNIGSALRGSLSVLGQSGTLADMGKGSSAVGKVQAKSGTITRVLCYVGYAQGPGSDLAFAIMLNRYTGKFKDTKKAVEQALILLTK